MKRKPIQSRLTTLLVAVAFVVTGGLALSFECKNRLLFVCFSSHIFPVLNCFCFSYNSM